MFICTINCQLELDLTLKALPPAKMKQVVEYLLLKILKYSKVLFLFKINVSLYCFHNAFTEPHKSLGPPNECTD